MAVTTTPQNVLDAAYGKSIKNVPGKIATDNTELLEVVHRALRGLYALAARINPYFFAKSVVVPHNGTGWPRPEDAESVVLIQNASADVGVVPIEDRAADSALPSVFRFGQLYRTAGNANDPTAGNLTFWYAKRSDKPASLSATLDATWVEQYNELLVLEVAIYLAIKDGRDDEVPALKMERDRWLRLFVAFLEHETANEQRRWGHERWLAGVTLMPLGDIVAGGTAVFDRRVAA